MSYMAVSDKEPKDFLEQFTFASQIYFHGKIEDKIGYDLVKLDKENLADLKKLDKTIKPIFVFNKYQSYSCTLFYWNGMGLICLNTDSDSLMDAQEKWINEVESL